jgi:hypothetical protein
MSENANSYRDLLDSLQACASSVLEAHGESVKNSLRIDLQIAISRARDALQSHQPEVERSYQPSPEVVEKEKTNTWDSLADFVKVWHAQQEGKWAWFANSRCKYVELRIDMRDGGCIIRDREGTRISPAELAYQYRSPATHGDGSNG